jgi:hypothetical protein
MRSIVTKSHAYSNITSLNFSELEEYMNDNVKYVITNSSWDDNFDEVWDIHRSYNKIKMWCAIFGRTLKKFVNNSLVNTFGKNMVQLSIKQWTSMFPSRLWWTTAYWRSWNLRGYMHAIKNDQSFPVNPILLLHSRIYSNVFM